jgi:hypothetical protein
MGPEAPVRYGAAAGATVDATLGSLLPADSLHDLAERL